MKAVWIAIFANLVGFALVQPVPAAEAATFREKILYSFCSDQNCTDGARPSASLINVKGTLYGTTPLGGVYGHGTVFAVDRSSGAETIVYSFCSQAQGYYCLDGSEPTAALINVKGVLYGTTTFGGDVGCAAHGCGTAFSIDLNTGVETVLHNFGASGDGAVPYAGLTYAKGMLYGTTFDGGGSCSCGTVFSLDPTTGAETVLHTFGDGIDGQEPFAGLTYVNGKLYGTAARAALTVPARYSPWIGARGKRRCFIRFARSSVARTEGTPKPI
jgi:uncharacterized repeat protein (TIGR03803 family)